MTECLIDRSKIVQQYYHDTKAVILLQPTEMMLQVIVTDNDNIIYAISYNIGMKLLLGKKSAGYRLNTLGAHRKYKAVKKQIIHGTFKGYDEWMN